MEEVADPFYNLPETQSPKGSLQPPPPPSGRLKGTEGGATAGDNICFITANAWTDVDKDQHFPWRTRSTSDELS